MMQTHEMMLVFVKHLNESVKGLRVSSDYEVSPVRLLRLRVVGLIDTSEAMH